MIRAEMKKYLYFPYLLLAVIGCVVLAFSANADYDPSGSAVSVFRLAITGIAHKSEQPIEYSALFMWIKGLASAYTAAFNVIWIYRSAFRGTAQRHDRFFAHKVGKCKVLCHKGDSRSAYRWNSFHDSEYCFRTYDAYCISGIYIIFRG